MTVDGGTAPSLGAFHTECGILFGHRHSVLLEGRCIDTDAALRLLQPHLRQPIVWNRRAEPLQLPHIATGALIVEDVGSLSPDDQRRLLAWTAGSGSSAQVVSTTEQPLFALVTRGGFDEALYYRLNILLLRVEALPPSGALAPVA